MSEKVVAGTDHCRDTEFFVLFKVTIVGVVQFRQTNTQISQCRLAERYAPMRFLNNHVIFLVYLLPSFFPYNERMFLMQHDSEKSSSCSWKTYKRRSPRRRCAPWASGSYNGHLQVDGCKCGIKPSYASVHKVVNELDSNRREIVQSLGFGGLLDFPNIGDTFKQFGCWLLGKVDVAGSELVVDDDIRVSLSPDQVGAVFSIPCSGRRIRDAGLQRDNKAANAVMNHIMRPGLSGCILQNVHAVVQSKHNLGQNPMDGDHFRVAFIFFVMGHIFAPSNRHSLDASPFWPALLRTDEIKHFKSSISTGVLTLLKISSLLHKQPLRMGPIVVTRPWPGDAFCSYRYAISYNY